jgi:phosphonate transport system substrate-binding protein
MSPYFTPLYGAERGITVAVVIDGSTPKKREPFQAYLTKAMGRSVLVVAPDSYQDTVASLANSSYDFACIGALVYIRAHAKYGVVPLVQRAIDLDYHSVFITGSDSSIHSLQDLKGKRFAFGDVDSTSAHLMARRELALAGIRPSIDLKVRYSGSHLATAALVASGTVDAGAIDKTVFDFLILNGQLDKAKVRVFYTSRSYVDYVWVAREGISQTEQARFSRALLALREGKDEPVLTILRARSFVVASDDEYGSTRQIAHNLKMF